MENSIYALWKDIESKESAIDSLSSAATYMLMTFDNKKIMIHTDIKDSALVFLGLIEIEKQKLLDDVKKRVKGYDNV